MASSSNNSLLPVYSSNNNSTSVNRKSFLGGSAGGANDDDDDAVGTAQKPPNIRILGIDLTPYSVGTQFFICCSGVFVFYLLYGYLQELIFTLDGFEPYGWFLTLIQFAYYTGFGFCERRMAAANPKRNIPLRTYALLAFLTLGTMGLSNSSLGYLNYPTQVIFKCCKLVPVLLGSVLIQKKAHGPLDFLAAVAMCVGLTLFTLGEFLFIFGRVGL